MDVRYALLRKQPPFIFSQEWCRKNSWAVLTLVCNPKNLVEHDEIRYIQFQRALLEKLIDSWFLGSLWIDVYTNCILTFVAFWGIWLCRLTYFGSNVLKWPFFLTHSTWCPLQEITILEATAEVKIRYTDHLVDGLWWLQAVCTSHSKRMK